MGPPSVPPYWFAFETIALQGEKVTGIELIVANELKSIAMKVIGARLGYTAYLPARSPFVPPVANMPLASTLNSCSASGNGMGLCQPS